MWLAKTVTKLVVLIVVAIGLLGASSATAIPARPAYPFAPSQSGDFAVDSFFDITYRIDFVGAPGSQLDGLSGSTTGAVHVQAGGGSGGACIVPDNGTGTADLPPVGCVYQSPDDRWMIIDGLPPGTTIEIDAILMDFLNTVEVPDDTLGVGGRRQSYDATLHMDMTGTGDLAGFSRIIEMPVAVETLSGPRTLGDPVQTFDTEMVSLQGYVMGDPDFDNLVITAGTDFGLPSPGITTLTEEMDYGDAPDPTYPTLSANNGASHVIAPGFHLGQVIDPEPDGQPDPGALGDDNDTLYPPANDDEDGITFTTPLLMGQTACMDVVLTDSSGSGGLLDAWIDFDGNGIWDPHEHLFGGPSQPLVARP